MTFHITGLPPSVAARLEADRELVRALRAVIADRIERDIAILDALSPDPDAEPSLGAPEPWYFSFNVLGLDGVARSMCDQTHWAAGSTDDGEHDAGEEREEENEHSGDVQDEPHDAEEDTGPEDWGRYLAGGTFDGWNYHRPRLVIGGSRL